MVFVRLNPLELTAGYRLGLAGGESLYGLFTEAARSCDLARKLSVFDCYSITHLNRMEKDTLNEEAFGWEVLRNARDVIIGRAFNHDEMASPKLLDEIEDCLVHMRDLVNQNGLHFTKQTIDSFTPHEAKEAGEVGDDEHPSQDETQEI